MGVTVSVVAWGYLVYAAIDFGSTARSGDSRAWWFLGLASAGAVACLFAGLMLVTRLLRRLGITHDAPSSAPSHDPAAQTRPAAPGTIPPAAPTVPPVRTPGGRRAAR